MTLKKIVVDMRAEEMVLRVLYTDQDGPNPGTKARARAVGKLARAGLRDALEALGGDVTMCGTSGFTQRQDTLVDLLRPDEPSEAKAAS